jgi:hypothetical protein
MEEMLQPIHLVEFYCVTSALPVSYKKLASALNSPSLRMCKHAHNLPPIRKHESKLLMGPPFCLPHFFQPNLIMATIVYIVNPMLCMVVAAKGFGVLKCLPFPIDGAPSRVILDFLQYPVR